MKIFYKYLLLGIAVCTAALTSCSNDEEGTAPVIDMETMNFTATPGEGQITLSWQVPENPGYLYLQLEYYDPREKKINKKNFSIFTQEYVVENTRARYGAAYNFKFTPYSDTGAAGTPVELKGITSGAAPIVNAVVEEKLELGTANFKALDDNGVKVIDMICDGITDQQENLYHTATTDVPHYVDINLGEELSRFKIKTYNSNKHDGANVGNPTNVKIFRLSSLEDTSVDVGTDDALICSVGLPNVGKSVTNEFIYPAEDSDELETPVQYIRFYATSETTYWNLAELEIYKVDYIISNPEVDEVEEYDK